MSAKTEMATIDATVAVGAQIDWLVAQALGRNPTFVIAGADTYVFMENKTGSISSWVSSRFSASPSQSQDLVEREKISTVWSPETQLWVVPAHDASLGVCATGSTQIEAAMRHFITYKLGARVQIPAALATPAQLETQEKAHA